MRNLPQTIQLDTREQLVAEWNRIVATMRDTDASLDLEFFGVLINLFGRMRRRGIVVNSGLQELLALLARDAFSFDDSDGTATGGRVYFRESVRTSIPLGTLTVGPR